MPQVAEWASRLPDIRARLEAMPYETIDRELIEEIFGVARRRAQLLMVEFGGRGKKRNTFTVSRQNVLKKLSEYESSDAVSRELERKQQLAVSLRRAKAPKIEVPYATFLSRIASLEEAGISLKKGLLLIPFGTAEDLLGKLFVLSRALANESGNLRDFEGDSPGALFEPPLARSTVQQLTGEGG